MKIVERENIDTEKWNALVDQTKDAAFFSYAWYLDATAENWCVLVNDNYSAGIALPYSKRLGVETLYTPIFVRYIEWLGDKRELKTCETFIRKRFKNIHISMRQKVLGVGYSAFVFQVLNPNKERRIGSQAKRMLKKAVKNDIQVTKSNNYLRIFEVINIELKNKITGIDKDSLKTLDRLFEAASKEKVLRSYEIENCGGIVCLAHEGQMLYLKGTVLSRTKEVGGMYKALNNAINEAHENKMIFDFGGSRVDGVKRFNHNLGGEDVEYYSYKVDKTPFWFKFARRIRSTWKK